MLDIDLRYPALSELVRLLIKPTIDAEDGRLADAWLKLDQKRTFGEQIDAPPAELWTECPSLRVVWVGEPQFSADSFRPKIVCEWHRP